MARQNYIVWYVSSSHKCRRYFLGVGQRRVPGHELSIPWPEWVEAKTVPQVLDAKHQAYYFDTMDQARGCVAFCESRNYRGLTIEPIDIPDIFVPNKAAINCKPPEAKT